MDDIKQPGKWAGWKQRFLKLLPCTCKICHQAASTLLGNQCRLELHHCENACEQCGEALPGRLLLTHSLAINRCGRCISNPPSFQRTLFAYDYNGAVAELIQQFKFSEALILSQLLADMIVERIKEHDFPLPDALIPVPLHKTRLKQRGFNQSLELARHISKALDIPIYNSLLFRTRATPKQSGLSRKARERNIKGAFSIKSNHTGTALTGKHLAIVD
ncbi:MAG: ComF family protein, partial [Proteobacteria bacterium]|nr:ComF family protein [Pseudomonadota bacterium]